MGSLGSVGLNAVSIGTFISSCVEMIEMVIIVVGVGTVRGWRSSMIGAVSGLVLLVGIVVGMGQALSLIPIDTVRIIIGALLLTFGLQWYRKGVIGVAAEGFTGGEEEEEVDATGGAGRGALDWTAFVLSFKGVLLEGLEIAFIVVAFGAGGGTSGGGGTSSYASAYVGALAAFVLIGLLGFAAKGWLENVPGQTLKFGVGGLLSTFGTYWMAEGLGVHWPTGQYSLAWLYLTYLASTFALMALTRAGALGPRPNAAGTAPGAVDPSGLAPASASSTRDFQRAHDLVDDGVVGPRTQAAIRAARELRGAVPRTQSLGVDPADADAIGTLQARLGLAETRAIDAPTRGALRVVQHPGVLDPTQPDEVRAFQRHHDMAPTGGVDGEAHAAMTAVRADASTAEGGAESDPLQRLDHLDILDEASICRFQRSLGLAPDGILGDETRGAARALSTLGGLPVEADSSGATTEPSPLRKTSVQQFQAERELAPTGDLDERTRQAIRWEREHHLGVDAARPESVCEFQRRHGLAADGEMGPRTQAAARAERSERETADAKAAERRYGPTEQRRDFRLLDPADPEDVCRFQERHALAATGAVDSATQAAMRAVRAQHAGDEHRSGGDHG